MKRPPKDTPALYAQDGRGYEAIVHAHYFLGSNDWLVTEYSPDEDTAFGWACLGGDRQNAELGYVSLAELESIRIEGSVLHVGDGKRYVLPMRVERDEGWSPIPLSSAIAMLDARQGRST